MLHPEAGHVFVTKHPEDVFESSCPYHPNCFEGLASGSAIEARWGKKAIHLANRREVWELEAFYISQAIVGYILTLSPHKIILGGGVMHQKQVLPLVHENVRSLLNGYLKTKELDEIENYILLPSLNDNQGIMGCLKLALNQLES